jgi:hypothetical protein
VTQQELKRRKQTLELELAKVNDDLKGGQQELLPALQIIAGYLAEQLIKHRRCIGDIAFMVIYQDGSGHVEIGRDAVGNPSSFQRKTNILGAHFSTVEELMKELTK